jgi:hypothetical protein
LHSVNATQSKQYEKEELLPGLLEAMETLPPLLCPFFFFVLVILRTVLLFLFGLCLLVPPVSSLFIFVLLPCFLCWFALFFS